ncbi:biotin synthase BioB, partial [Candidatus Omnitrophota bacterium]
SKYMNQYYNALAQKSIEGEILARKTALEILASPEIELLPLLNATFMVRQKFTGKSVTIHIIDNVENGYCTEDCRYCAQSKNSEASIGKYSIKTDEEILKEAQSAYENGAFRHCMVFSGQKPSQKRIDHLCALVKKIKSTVKMELCISTGIVNEAEARQLKAAGLDRINHNLNTSEKLYPEICTTHTYQDRLNTLKAAKKANLDVCSGVIIGMGESHDDIIEMALTLREYQAASIPVNFFIPIEGTGVEKPQNLTPEFCLRVLCLFRLLNPKAEIRVAAGREIYLRRMEVLAFYAANSLFLGGYLNTHGSETIQTLQMLKDAGFTIESDHSLDQLLEKNKDQHKSTKENNPYALKSMGDLRPEI